MPIYSNALRAAPLLLPLFAIVAATAGLASRLGTLPNVENLIFVSYATMLSGILPSCVLLGIALLIADVRWPSTRPILLGLAIGLACVALSVSYFYGRGLDF